MFSPALRASISGLWPHIDFLKTLRLRSKALVFGRKTLVRGRKLLSEVENLVTVKSTRTPALRVSVSGLRPHIDFAKTFRLLELIRCRLVADVQRFGPECQPRNRDRNPTPLDAAGIDIWRFKRFIPILGNKMGGPT